MQVEVDGFVVGSVVIDVPGSSAFGQAMVPYDRAILQHCMCTR